MALASDALDLLERQPWPGSLSLTPTRPGGGGTLGAGCGGSRLSLMAYNLGNLCRRLVLPVKIDNWSLASLQKTVGEDRWQAGEACPVLLAAAGGESSDGAVVRKHGAADRGAAGADGVKVQSGRVRIRRRKEAETKRCRRSR